MQTILVLTDFSDNAFLAAEYAGMLSKKWKSSRIIILYHAYQTIGTENTSVAEGDGNIAHESSQIMKVWQESLREFVSPDTVISFLVEDIYLEEGINRLCEQEKVDLVVMGLTGRTGLEKIIIGSNAIRVMENCSHPLLLVPWSTAICYPKTILLTTDLKGVKEKMDIPVLDELLSLLAARLLVLNVAQKEESPVTLRKEIDSLHTALSKYDPETYYISHQDTVEGINTFATDHEIELIITLRQQPTWLSGLFRKSVSKQLAWNSKIPLLILPVSQS